MMSAVAGAPRMLSGIDTKTGPPGGVDANFSARRVVSGIELPDSASHHHLVSGCIINS